MHSFKVLGIFKLLSRFERFESRRGLICDGLSRGRSRHRHDRCTLEDQALLSVLGTAIARPQQDGPSQAAFSVFLQAVNVQQRNPPRKSRLQATGVFSLSLSALGGGCAPNLPRVRDRFFFVLCLLWDSSRVHHMSPQGFQLLPERDHFMFSEILAMPLSHLHYLYWVLVRDIFLDVQFPGIPYIPYISMPFPVLRRGLFHTSCRLCSFLDTWVGYSSFSSSTLSPDVQLLSPADPKLFLLGC